MIVPKEKIKGKVWNSRAGSRCYKIEHFLSSSTLDQKQLITSQDHLKSVVLCRKLPINFFSCNFTSTPGPLFCLRTHKFNQRLLCCTMALIVKEEKTFPFSLVCKGVLKTMASFPWFLFPGLLRMRTDGTVFLLAASVIKRWGDSTGPSDSQSSLLLFKF